MPDIAMCQSACPLSKQCHRHADSGTVPCEHRQCYFAPSTTGKDCDHFWPASRGTTTAQLVAMHLESEGDNDRHMAYQPTEYTGESD